MQRAACVLCLAVALLATPVVSAQTGSPRSNAAGLEMLSNTQWWRFDDIRVGEPPPGAVVLTGDWSVRAEPDAPSPPNALCQTGDAEYPSIVLSTNSYTDVVMTARIKVMPDVQISNPTGGLIFRMRDKHHFYMVRMNTAEGVGNVKFYKYWLGTRSLIQFQAVPLQRGRWYEMRVEMKGDRMIASMDGKTVIDRIDKTYPGGGRVGLWVKNDSSTCFDNIMVGEMTDSTKGKTQ